MSDPNERTKLDMEKARAGTSINVEAVRDYLYSALINTYIND